MYYFIVNEHGGSGKSASSSLWDEIKSALQAKGVRYKAFVPQYAGHATVLARQISEEADDDIRIVIVGGDGTINEVINGILSFERVKLGLIPSGSGNDFARGLGIPRHNAEKALDMILESESGTPVDLGFVKTGEKQRLFAISAGFGLDAIVCTQSNTSKIKTALNKIKMGNMSYALLTVINLFKMKTRNVKISFDGGALESFDKLIFAAAMNLKAEGGGVPMSPNAKVNDGKLSFCLAAGVPKVKTFFLFPMLLAGKHARFKGFTLRDCKTADIYSQTPEILHTDGEHAATDSKIHIECLEKKLRVLLRLPTKKRKIKSCAKK